MTGNQGNSESKETCLVRGTDDGTISVCLGIMAHLQEACALFEIRGENGGLGLIRTNKAYDSFVGEWDSSVLETSVVSVVTAGSDRPILHAHLQRHHQTKGYGGSKGWLSQAH